MRVSLLERAFQLAATGRYTTMTAVRHALKTEGYAGAESYLQGAGVRKQIRTIIRDARATPDQAEASQAAA